MKFSYRLNKLCGSIHRNGNLLYTPDGNKLLSCIGTRVTVFDLINHTCMTLPYEHTTPIARISISPDSRLLLSVDVTGNLLLIHLGRRFILARMKLKKKEIKDMKFSPNGKYFCITQGKTVQVWKTPMNGKKREFQPFVLHRTYGGHTDDVTCLDWSECGLYFVTGSKDLSCRVWSLYKMENFVPFTLTGHRDYITGVYFAKGTREIYSLAKDGHIFTWDWREEEILQLGEGNMIENQMEKHDEIENDDDSDNDNNNNNNNGSDDDDDDDNDKHNTNSQGIVIRKKNKMENKKNLIKGFMTLNQGRWKCKERNFAKRGFHVKLISSAFNRTNSLLILGYSDGVFGIYEMPGLINVHTLSVSKAAIGSIAINSTSEWLGIGCPSLGQLLVWEWRSETYVMKQQGHAYNLNTLAVSPDGQIYVTGGDDNKVKLWHANSGFSFVTFTEHTAPVTAVEFLGTGQAVLSASLDGTVRAHDLIRYRNFRTLTTPTPVQLISLTTDPSGEVVCAGALEPFEIYVWSLQTGKLLDVLSGHEGPVVSLSFNPTQSVLASGSWDKKVKLWNVYENECIETFDHASDVLDVTYRPDGKQLAVATLNGNLIIWDSDNAKIEKTIEGEKDIASGRKMTDRVSASNNSASKHFTSICYTADGSCIIAGGKSKYVCIYEISNKMLVKKFQVSHNRMLDGVLNELHSGNMTSAGPKELLDLDQSDDEFKDKASLALPGASQNSDGSRNARPEVRVNAIKFSSTGREWAAATQEGLMIYALEEDMIFDPLDLDEAITPEAIKAAIYEKEYAKGIMMALHLNEENEMIFAVDAVPFDNIPLVTRNFSSAYLIRFLQFLAKRMQTSPHVEYHLQWSQCMLQFHGIYMRKERAKFMIVFRALQKSIQRYQNDLIKLSDSNQYILNYFGSQAKKAKEQEQEKPSSVSVSQQLLLTNSTNEENDNENEKKTIVEEEEEEMDQEEDVNNNGTNSDLKKKIISKNKVNTKKRKKSL